MNKKNKKQIKKRFLVLTLISILSLSGTVPLFEFNSYFNTGDIQDDSNNINSIPLDGIVSDDGDTSTFIEKFLADNQIQSLTNKNSHVFGLMDEKLKSSGGSSINEILSSQPLSIPNGQSAQNYYIASYNVNDPVYNTVSVGPYGIDTGVFGSDYHVANIYDWGSYTGGESQFNQDFLNIINAPLYPSSGTTNVNYNPFPQFERMDAGVKNLLQRIGGTQEIYKDGTFIMDVVALPRESVLTNPFSNPQYHKPISIKIQETWETYTLSYYGTEIYGAGGGFYENPYPMLTLYVPHIKIDFELAPAFANHFNTRRANAGLGTISDFDEEFKEIMGKEEKIMEWICKLDEPTDFKKSIKGKAKDWIEEALVKAFILGFFPGSDMEDAELGFEVYSFVKDMINIFTMGDGFEMNLITMLLRAELLKARDAGIEMRTVNYANYQTTVNYLKSAIYAAIQISKNIFQNTQAYAIVNQDIPSEEPSWFLDKNIYNAVEISTGNPKFSYNAERWGSSAVITAFAKDFSQIDDYNSDGKTDWTDIGLDGYYTAHYDTIWEEAYEGESKANYYVHHCLSTTLASLVYYFNLNAKFIFDSKSDEIPDSTYSLDIFSIQDTNDPPDEFRKRVFGVFATFGLAHNVFRNLYTTNTLWSLNYSPNVVDSDKDGLTDLEENNYGSNLYHPDSDGDGIDDKSELLYWGHPLAHQTTADSDGDFFTDVEELYYFGSNPTIVDQDLDGDGLTLGEEASNNANPRDSDTDDDYLPDGAEVKSFNTEPDDSDTDGDEIIDGIEVYQFETDPANPDTDGDGLSDKDEIYGVPVVILGQSIRSYSDPFILDTDNDGLEDGIEWSSHGTLPGYYDTDGDGLSDGWEVSNGFNPLDNTDPLFQFSYSLPVNPTNLNPGSFSWSVSDYYPREIVDVSIKYRINDAAWIEISTSSSGTYSLLDTVGVHYFTVSATNDIGLSVTYQNMNVNVEASIPPGPPTVYCSDDLIYQYGDTNPHIASFLLLDNSIDDPKMLWILDHKYDLFGYLSWTSGDAPGFNVADLVIDGNPLTPGIHTITILVWDDYSGSPNDYVYEHIYVWIQDEDIEQLPILMADQYYSGGIESPYFNFYPLHGIPRSFGNTRIICEQIHIVGRTGIMAGIWDENPMIGTDPFEDEGCYFIIEGSAPANFTSGYHTQFTVPLPDNYDPYTDTFILMTWNYASNTWEQADYELNVDWIKGTVTINLLKWGIFALGKYIPPTIVMPADLSYVFDDQNINTYQLTWTVEKSYITGPYAAIYINYNWNNPIGEIFDWYEGLSITVNINSDALPIGVHTLTAVFYDDIVNDWIRHDVKIWVLRTGVLALTDMESAKLYNPGTYVDIVLGAFKINNMTTTGATIVIGGWNQNPIQGNTDPFNNDGVYFAIETDVADYAITYDDPEYPFIISVPLPLNYDPNNDVLTLMTWDEDEEIWTFTDFSIIVDQSSGVARITMKYLGIFALGVIKPVDTTPPIISIEYIDGIQTDGNPGNWIVNVHDNESGNNFASIKIYIDGILVGEGIGEYSVPNTLGTHTILVEVIDNNPINPQTTSNSSSIDIIDDDIIAPEIQYNYTGDGTEKNSGEIFVTTIDASGCSIDSSGTYNVPDVIGTYVFTFTATDADDDRDGDSLETTISVSITIMESEKVMLYEEDFNGFETDPSKIWDLYDINDEIIEFAETPTEDAYTDNQNPDETFGNTDNLITEKTYPPSQTITILDRNYCNWDHPAETTITIPDLPIESCILEYQGYSDPDEPYLRAIFFSLDEKGGWIGTRRVGPGQVRGYGTMNPGQTKTWTFDMNYCQFAASTTGSVYYNFIPQNENDISGFFSPGTHDVKAFISSQDDFSGPTQDSWITVKLHLVFKSVEKEANLKCEIPYLTQSITDNSLLDLYVKSGDLGEKVDIYAISDFSEDSITWNNQPSALTYLNTDTIDTYDLNQIDLGSIPSNAYRIVINDETTALIEYYSKECSNIAKHPVIRHYISKIHQGNGVLYCQTDTSEQLTLRSQNNLNIQLMEGDVIEVKFNTTSINKISCNLRNLGSEQISFTISEQDNYNFDSRIVKLVVDESMVIDQVEFSGLFEDTKNLIIDSLKIYKYEEYPEANFTCNATSIFVQESIEFSFTGFGGNLPASYLWDFGDGITSTEENPSHQFNSAGIYNITLVVTDWDGDSDVLVKNNFIQVNNTHVGNDIEVIDPETNINITFSEVVDEGLTTIVKTEEEPEPPSGFNISNDFYDISTTASFTNDISVSFPYDEAQIQGNEADLRLFHWDDENGWEDVTTHVDVENNVIHGIITSFSIFTLMLQVDFTPPITSMNVTNSSVGDDNFLHVAYNSSFSLEAIDDQTEISGTFYRINGGSWYEYLESFELSGPPGNYLIEYYSLDTLGNVETVNSKNVILEAEFDMEICGLGKLKIADKVYFGKAIFSISEKWIQMEIDDQVAVWTVKNRKTRGRFEVIHAECVLGKITITIYHGRWFSNILAIGKGTFFSGFF